MESLPRCCAPPSGTPLDDTAAAELAAALKAMADPVRLRIVSLLSANGELCVCDFVEPLGVSQPTVSHHLRTLVAAGILQRRKDGRWAHYSLVPDRLSEVAGALAPGEVVHR
jgi:ArsR family transcriptional regulator